VHLNVSNGTSKVWQALKRIKWMPLAIFGPEVLLYIAWMQWQLPRELRDETNCVGLDSMSGKEEYVSLPFLDKYLRF
jgi:hypothetical protein